MNCYTILGISVDERRETSVEIQKILTQHGCEIQARLGLPQQDRDACSNKGLLILQMCATEEDISNIKAELNQLQGVNADYMTL